MRVRTSRASVISIHAPRTGSDEGGQRFIRGQGISIHAPRTGSDKANGHSQFKQSISIHAPRTGSDVVGHAQKVFALAFQSTLPARGATLLQDADGNPGRISIHAPRTGSDARALALLPCLRESSIHAPRTGSDKRGIQPL